MVAARSICLRYGFALAAVSAGAGTRVLLLPEAGRGVAYLTFYPAVMVAALYGGLVPGLLATAASAALAGWWIQNATLSFPEWLAMGVFVMSCTMISCVCQAMHRASDRAQEARRQAEDANRAKSVFLANMSHELRTPLNAILGFSKLMTQDSHISAENRRTLEIINRSGEHLLGLINNVLDVAKIEAGRTAAQKNIFDLHAMMRDIADLMRQRAQAKGIFLALELTDGLPNVVGTDESKLRQIVLNLVGNAVKYTTQGGVTLRLLTKSSAEPHQANLVIEVHDSGDGVAPEDQKRIFEPFVQIGHKSAPAPGTGLGLTITRQFADLLGGTVCLESVPGQGATFIVELPVTVEETTAMAGIRDRQSGLVHLEPHQPECRVLIVEDQEENWQLLKPLLERAGFVVRVAVNGKQGVETFESWRPHFIWMDWRMPIMDGLEATRRIRGLEGGRDVKIVALSASVFREEREQILLAGANDFVAKPIQFSSIYGCMAKQLGVRFVSNAPKASSASEAFSDVDLAGVAALPIPLRTELEDALVSLDAARISAAAKRVSEIDPELGRVLDPYIDKFRYTSILQVLQSQCSDMQNRKMTI